MRKNEPCPFCNRDDELSVQPDKEGRRIYAYHVHCGVCGCNGRNNYPIGWCETPEAAWEAWNHRGSVRPVFDLAASQSQLFSIEPHGPGGQYALYHGRDMHHHGARLCNLYDFDSAGERTRKSIVDALNANAHLGPPRLAEEFIGELEKLVDSMRDELHRSYRIIAALRCGKD